MRESIVVTPKNLILQIGRSGLDLGKDNTPVDPPSEGLYFGGDTYDLSLTMHHETHEKRTPVNRDTTLFTACFKESGCCVMMLL